MQIKSDPFRYNDPSKWPHTYPADRQVAFVNREHVQVYTYSAFANTARGRVRIDYEVFTTRPSDVPLKNSPGPNFAQECVASIAKTQTVPPSYHTESKTVLGLQGISKSDVPF